MGAGTEVQIDALRQHEAEVRQLAGQIDQALGAAGSAQALGDSAFGLVGQIIAAPVQLWISGATDSLQKLSQTGHKVADAVRDTHTSYSDTDTANAQTMKSIGGGSR